MDSISPSLQPLGLEVRNCPQTPHSSPNGQPARSPYDQRSASTRRRLADTLWWKWHQNSDERDGYEGPPTLSRRRSIIGLLGSVSSKTQRQSEQDKCKNENPIKRPKTTSPRKSDSVDTSPTHLIHRRKSLSGLFGSISHKVSPKRSLLFRKSEDKSRIAGATTNETDGETNPSTLPRIQAAAPKLDEQPALFPLPDSYANPACISFAERLVEVLEDIKESQLGSRRSSNSSSCTWASHVLGLEPRTTTQKQAVWDHGMEADRISTPDSYLQLLIESHSPTVHSPIVMQEYQHKSPSPSKCKPVQPVDFLENSFNESNFLKNCMKDKEPPIISIFEFDSSFEKQLKSSVTELTDPDSKNTTQHLQNSACEVSSPQLIPLGVTVFLPQLNQHKDEDCSNFCRTRGEREGQKDELLEKRISLTVAKMTKNFHADRIGHSNSIQKTSRYCFERDEDRAWDAVITGREILSQTSPQQRLKSFPSIENIFFSTHGQQQGEKMPSIINDQHSKHPGYAVPQNVVPIRLQTYSTFNQLSRENAQDSDPLGNHLSIEYPLLCRYSKSSVINEPASSTTITHEKLKRQAATRFSKTHTIAAQNIEPVLIEDRNINTYPNVAMELTNEWECRRREDCSVGGIRVEYPSVIQQAAHVKSYESKESAIAAMLNYEHCELSEYAILDPQNRTIYARLPEAGNIDPGVMIQHGLEVFWLPIYSKVTGTTQNSNLETASREGPLIREQTITATSRSPSRRAEDALANYLSIRNVSHLQESPVKHEEISRLLELEPTVHRDEEIESIVDDNFFLDIESETAESFLDSDYSEQPHTSSLLNIATNKEEISRSCSGSEVLYWGYEEETIPSAPTWAELGRAHLAKTSLSRTKRTSTSEPSSLDPQRYNSVAMRSDLSHEPFPKETILLKSSFLRCPKSGLYEKVNWREREDHGFCEKCQTKVLLREYDIDHKSSYPYMISVALDSDLDSTQFIEESEGESMESEFAKNSSSVAEAGNHMPSLGDSGGLIKTYSCSPGVLESFVLEKSVEDLVSPGVSNASKGISVNTERARTEPVGENLGEVRLPRLSTTNGRDFTLQLPIQSDFSWASFLEGNVDGLMPFYGCSGKGTSDEIDLSDTPISSLFGVSTNLLAEHENCKLTGSKKSYPEEMLDLDEEPSPPIVEFPPLFSDKNTDFQGAIHEPIEEMSEYTLEFEITDYGIIQKSDPTFAIIISEITDCDVSPAFDEPPETRENISKNLSSGVSLTESRVSLQRDRKASENSNQSGLSSDVTTSSENTGEFSYETLAAISIHPGSRWLEHGDQIQFTSRECSYGSHGEISMLSGFKFSHHRDLLVDDSSQVHVEGSDQEFRASGVIQPTHIMPSSTPLIPDELISPLELRTDFPPSQSEYARDMSMRFTSEDSLPRREFYDLIDLRPGLTEQNALHLPALRVPTNSMPFIGNLQARGSLDRGFGFSRQPHGFPPSSKIKTISPPLRSTSGMSSLDTDTSSVSWPVEATPQSDAKDFEVAGKISA